jgi:hypothetical protein
MDNADIGEPTGNVECPQTCSAFQNCGPSIRCNAPDRINDGYFNGLLKQLQVHKVPEACPHRLRQRIHQSILRAAPVQAHRCR